MIPSMYCRVDTNVKCTMTDGHSKLFGDVSTVLVCENVRMSIPLLDPLRRVIDVLCCKNEGK
jgi:hypothetical protein